MSAAVSASPNVAVSATDKLNVFAIVPESLTVRFAAESDANVVGKSPAASMIAVLPSDTPKDPDIVIVRAKVLAAPSLKSNSLVIVTASVSTAFSEMMDDKDWLRLPVADS